MLRKTALISAICVGLSAVAISTSAFAADKIHWRLQSNLNAGEPGFVAVQEKFAKLATEMSGGRITFEVFPVGALFPVKDGLEAVASGVTEMALLTGGYYAGKIGPFANLESGVPGSLHSATERYAFFYKKGFIDLAREAYGKHGVYYLGPQLSSGWDIMSKKPLTSMADFKGLKIRVQASRVLVRQMQEMGSAPSVTPLIDVYQALKDGRLDGHENTPSNIYSQRLHEGQSHLTVSNHGYLAYAVIVNKAFWDKLPAGIRTTLEGAMRDATTA